MPSGTYFSTTPDWRHFLAGSGAGFVNVTITFPIQKIIFRQMLGGVSTRNAVNQLQSEGLTHLYRGLLPPLMQKCTTTSIMFGTNQYYGEVLGEAFPNLPIPLTKYSGSALAGATEMILTPLERVQTLLLDSQYHGKFKNTSDAFVYIWKSHGVLELFRGGVPILLRNSIASVLFFYSKDKFMEIVPKRETKVAQYVFSFIIGGIIGGAISSLFFPLNVVRATQQSRLGGKFESTWFIFKKVLGEREWRFRAMFRGVHIHFTRALLSWGLQNATYDLIMSILK